ncbi:hypothetical protein ISN75_04445 [Dyella marensis]|uniref:hypothetical protein n=1 Tax=Dyella marensis TaxID=500610 RepID=UPI0031D9DB93
MKQNISLMVAAAMSLALGLPVAQATDHVVSGRPEQGLVVTVTKEGSYRFCGDVQDEQGVRARLTIAALQVPEPVLRIFVEGGIETQAGTKALHALLIDVSDSGLTHIVIDRPDPRSVSSPPSC